MWRLGLRVCRGRRLSIVTRGKQTFDHRDEDPPNHMENPIHE